jgi:hypothetical protein
MPFGNILFEAIRPKKYLLIFRSLSFRVAAVSGCIYPVAVVFGMTAIQTPIPVVAACDKKCLSDRH